MAEHPEHPLTRDDDQRALPGGAVIDESADRVSCADRAEDGNWATSVPITVDAHHRLARLLHDPLRPRVVVDTDAFNEIDDQFAVSLAALCAEQMRLEAVYAAPFHNTRSQGASDGMEQSFDEIIRMVDLLSPKLDHVTVCRGSSRWSGEGEPPEVSEAVLDLCARAQRHDDVLYVIALGAPTNVVNALRHQPDLIDRIVVIWLGGHPLSWHSAREFNLMQDVFATRYLLDCGVPLVLVPCGLVAGSLTLSLPEVERYVEPMGPVGGYLASIFRGAVEDFPGATRTIWDLAAVSWVCNRSAILDELTTSPLLSQDLRFDVEPGRHQIRVVTRVDRDLVMQQLFMVLQRHRGDCLQAVVQ